MSSSIGGIAAAAAIAGPSSPDEVQEIKGGKSPMAGEAIAGKSIAVPAAGASSMEEIDRGRGKNQKKRKVPFSKPPWCDAGRRDEIA